MRAVDINGVYEPASDSPSDVLLQLRWDDIALITVAGRVLSLAQYTPAAVRGGQPGCLVRRGRAVVWWVVQHIARVRPACSAWLV